MKSLSLTCGLPGNREGQKRRKGRIIIGVCGGMRGGLIIPTLRFGSRGPNEEVKRFPPIHL